jgi:hypothetical protein
VDSSSTSCLFDALGDDGFAATARAAWLTPARRTRDTPPAPPLIHLRCALCTRVCVTQGAEFELVEDELLGVPTRQYDTVSFSYARRHVTVRITRAQRCAWRRVGQPADHAHDAPIALWLPP